MFSTMCFDAFSGLGRVGDRIVLWECHGGANQRWTLTAAGELKGTGSGLCVTLNNGATADSTGMAIQTCTGAASQKWAYGSVNGDKPPVAAFTVSCTGTHCYFNSSASSDDQGIATRAWDYGDGTTAGNLVSPYKIYAGGGTFHVTLTVTDVAGQSTSLTKDVVIVAASNQSPDGELHLLVHQPRPATSPTAARTATARSSGGAGPSGTAAPRRRRTHRARTPRAARTPSCSPRPTTRARPAASRNRSPSAHPRRRRAAYRSRAGCRASASVSRAATARRNAAGDRAVREPQRAAVHHAGGRHVGGDHGVRRVHLRRRGRRRGTATATGS